MKFVINTVFAIDGLCALGLMYCHAQLGHSWLAVADVCEVFAAIVLLLVFNFLYELKPRWTVKNNVAG